MMVLANIQDRSLTDPFFAPIWEAIDDLSLPLLVHPTDPPGADLMDRAGTTSLGRLALCLTPRCASPG